MYKRKEVIGDITLYLGDALEVMPILDKVDSIVCDPPFGMCFVSNFRREDTKHKAIANDKQTLLLDWVCNLETNHSKYVFCRWDNLKDVPQPKSVITWIKDNHSMGDLKHEHARQTELCLFYKGAGHYFPTKRPNDVIKCSRTGNELHPTQKPVALMQEIIKWTSGIVVDCFMGSGSTLVACAKMGRKGIGIELDEDYFNIACERVRKAYASPDMFVEAEKKTAEQRGFDL